MSPDGLRGKRDKQSLDHVLRSMLAGGMAGCVAKTAVAPLDRVKILFQASNPDFQKYSGTWTGVFRAARDIKRYDGIRGLFQGHSATLLRIFPYAAIKFMAYDQAHDFLMPTRASETNFRRFSAGAISGTISVLFTYPLELVRVRLAFQTRATSSPLQRPTLSRTVRTIYHEGVVPLPASPASVPLPASSLTLSAGRTSNRAIFQTFPILKFYRGFSVTVLGMIPYAGTSFLVWGYLRSIFIPEPPAPSITSSTSRPDRLSTHPKSKPHLVADLVIGAISGATAQTVSYPFEVIRRRQQVGGLVRPSRWLGFRETVRDVRARGGWRGFFVGLSIGYLKIVPMTAVSFASWEWGKRALGI